MTVPIIPGPFSFLNTIGQGIAGYAQGKEQRRQKLREEGQQDRAEALKQVGLVFDAVQNNELSTNALKSPFFLKMLQRSGIAESFSPDNVAAKPQEAIDTGRSAYFQSVLGPQGNPTEAAQVLATGRPVSQSEALQERGAALVGGLKTRQLEGGLNPAQQSAVTGIPTAPTATAADQSAQNPELAGIAKRVVRDLYVKNGNKIPTVADAIAGASTDQRAKPFTNELTPAFLGSAIRDLQAELIDEETKRIAASTRASTNAANVVKDIKGQQEELRQRIKGRSDENNDLMKQLSPLAKLPKVDPSQISDNDKAILSKITANNTANGTDQETLTGLNQQAGQVIAPRVTAAKGAPEGAIAQKRLEWDRRAKAIRSHPNDPRVRGKKVEDLIGPRP